ncbi:DUF6973 domain-containing protein [Paenibacillus ginsengihumi]|uniref:DUF6973 domain-containing protein n=1 Tax=Paenibacillus ginsengihumi TaxID=431596 RepID=UPI003CCC2B1F
MYNDSRLQNITIVFPSWCTLFAAWNIWIIDFTSDSFWADGWTTAHEIGATGQPQIEYDMDMHNNSIGRMYATINGISENSSVTAMRKTIHDAYVSGSLWRIVADRINISLAHQ